MVEIEILDGIAAVRFDVRPTSPSDMGKIETLAHLACLRESLEAWEQRPIDRYIEDRFGGAQARLLIDVPATYLPYTQTTLRPTDVVHRGYVAGKIPYTTIQTILDIDQKAHLLSEGVDFNNAPHQLPTALKIGYFAGAGKNRFLVNPWPAVALYGSKERLVAEGIDVTRPTLRSMQVYANMWRQFNYRVNE